ncbi:NAD(P)/FAD-dependent oxidoreductase [Mycolicibacterium parafortuitum]|uniref:Reductase [Rhodococcus jostii RHA1] n=1 Tax=Mycolicibacterium parafortuitum TaxID=39692 RepID=A0A375YGX1_MYCPF|nr:FAD-dependent oxidoreductase [Mycolicibacterium parafortuitum]ORB28713.1 pyridine nucleotide-disulfide oxidoreductase [Mycolicibacterium parafortuitum]SRX80361.1 reductase [Rhodococcus jostii RHA1] [Mycolicibacterium parafortuitum]
MNRPTYVTVGAGQAAAVAARNLRRGGFDGRIVLIGDEAHAPYQRPPLSKEFLAGTDSQDSLWILPEQWRADNDVELLTGTTVTRIDTATRRVEFAEGPALPADAVLLATGGSPRRLPVPGPRPDLVHYLRTLDDAAGLAQQLAPGRRLAVIGAGFIGLEVAATATAAGAAVTVLEAAEIPLAAVIGPEMGRRVCALHRDHGVDLRTGAGVSAIRTTADHVLIDVAGAAAPLEFDAVVIGIGILPNTAVAAASGLAVDDGIVVDAAGRTAVAGVYAAGDVARRYSERRGRHVRVEHFDNASRQGVAVAGAMLGRDTVNDDPHWFWSDQFDRNMQFLGTASAGVVVRGDADGLDFTAFFFDGPHLCGAFAVERGEDISVARELLGRTVDPAVLGDEDADLWDLAYGEDDLVAEGAGA